MFLVFLYFVVRIRRRRKKFTFAISSADEFLFVTSVKIYDNNFSVCLDGVLHIIFVTVFFHSNWNRFYGYRRWKCHRSCQL